MADQFMEQPMMEALATGRASIETAAKVMASPEHPKYTADRAVAKKLVGGRSGLIAAIDGVGSGGQTSAQAAEIVQQNLSSIETQLTAPPTINQAVTLLRNLIFGATAQIRELQRVVGNSDVDTTVSVGIVCESPDGKRRFLVFANVGDSRIYRYRPDSGEVIQLTVDHTLVQKLVDARRISPHQAFSHPLRNVVYRTVGSLESSEEIDIGVIEILEGDIYLAVSDGVSDNITPHGLPVAVRSEFQAAYDPRLGGPDLKKFASDLAQRARNIQTGTQAGHAKPDDICVAVLRVPRVK